MMRLPGHSPDFREKMKNGKWKMRYEKCRYHDPRSTRIHSSVFSRIMIRLSRGWFEVAHHSLSRHFEFSFSRVAP
jgi:hypothetical protein